LTPLQCHQAFAALVALQAASQGLRQLPGHVEGQAPVEGQKVRVAEQPGGPASLCQRGFDQPRGYPLTAPLRVDEQPGQPEAIAHRAQAQARDDARAPRYPQLSVARCTHA